MKYQRRLFHIETWNNRIASWEKFATVSNKDKMFQFLKRTFAVVQYAPEGKKRTKYRDLGSYSSFCKQMTGNDYVRLYAEYKDGTHFFIKCYWSFLE